MITLASGRERVSWAMGSALISVAASFFTPNAMAGSVSYGVSDAGTAGCYTANAIAAPHDLWNNRLGNGSCKQYYRLDQGTINISYEEQAGTHLLQVEHRIELDLLDDTAFQFGVGANVKTDELGASARLDVNKWLYTLVASEWDAGAKIWRTTGTVWPALYDWKLGKHWELNSELTLVPIQGAPWLFVAALLGLAGYNSRKRKRH